MFRDFPFADVVAKAQALEAAGHEVFQKFTCQGCGARLTMDVAGHFFEKGTWDRCETVPDIRKCGCNFMLHMWLR